jgi:lipopolysaccharide export system protein LptA
VKIAVIPKSSQIPRSGSSRKLKPVRKIFAFLPLLCVSAICVSVGAIAFSVISINGIAPVALAQTANTALTIRADIQEANSITGVVTATGNVQMNYPARQINATAAQAQYYSKEQRVVLTGNVVVIQQGVNSLKAETITYLVTEGKFVAQPPANQQVESIYVVPDRDAAATTATTATPVTQIKPAFKNQVSPLVVPPKPQDLPAGNK